MAEIRAIYKRTFQVKSYESETVELSITDTVPDEALPESGYARQAVLAKLAQSLHADLAVAGDGIILSRMENAPKAPLVPKDPFA